MAKQNLYIYHTNLTFACLDYYLSDYEYFSINLILNELLILLIITLILLAAVHSRFIFHFTHILQTQVICVNLKY